MQNILQLVGDDLVRVQNFQVGLLRHVVGDPLPVVGDPLGVVGDPPRVVGYRLVWCLKKAKTWLNKVLSK